MCLHMCRGKGQGSNHRLQCELCDKFCHPACAARMNGEESAPDVMPVDGQEQQWRCPICSSPAYNKGHDDGYEEGVCALGGLWTYHQRARPRARSTSACGRAASSTAPRTGARRATWTTTTCSTSLSCASSAGCTRPAPRRPRGPTPTSAQKKLHVFSMLKTKLRLNRPSTGSKAKRRYVLATCFKFNKHTLLTPC